MLLEGYWSIYTAVMNALQLSDGRTLDLDRPLIMGILNVTPDSFSDGGRWVEPEAAVRHGLMMARQGADVIDVGGESTRPGAKRVAGDEQKRRVIAVIELLRKQLDHYGPDVAISIDTTLVQVATAALDAGATIINDVSAGREDDMMFTLAAQRDTPIILMHMRGQPADMQDDPQYEDVVAQVKSFLLERAEAARAMGVAQGQVMIDPGIGFGKTSSQNLTLLAGLHEFVKTGFAVMLGTSRKRFMGAIGRPSGAEPIPPHERVGATCATTALGVGAGVAMFRVHDVQANRQAADVAWAITNP